MYIDISTYEYGALHSHGVPHKTDGFWTENPSIEMDDVGLPPWSQPGRYSPQSVPVAVSWNGVCQRSHLLGEVMNQSIWSYPIVKQTQSYIGGFQLVMGVPLYRWMVFNGKPY